MTDPLTTLRNCYMNDDDIILDENNVIVGNFSWPKDVKTNYLMWGSGKDGSPREYYTLGCIVFFLRKLAFPHSMYVRQAAAENIPVVRRPDRKDMLAYLSGDPNANAAIDRSAPLQSEPPTRIKRPPEEASSDVEGGGAASAVSSASAGGGAATGAGGGGGNASLPWGPVAKRPRVDDVRGGCRVAQRGKDQFASRASARHDACVTLDNIKSLSEAMSVEKIAAIKAKRLAKKRTSIVKGLDDVVGPGAAAGCVGGEAGAGKEALQMDEDLTRAIIARERQWRTRTTILQSAGKSFSKSILAILHSIKAREHGKLPPGRRGSGPPCPMGATSAATAAFGASAPGTQRPGATQPHSAYNRYDQERFIQQKKETEGFKIDTMGTYHGMTLESVTGGKTPRRPGGGSSNAPSGASTPTRHALPSPHHAHQEHLQSGLVPAIMKRISRTPIIIIPAAAASLISMYNAKDILQDLRYVSSEVRRAEGGRRDGEVLLQRRKEGGLTVPYRVIDNPRKLMPADWQRVVAVFVMGPAWQFKGWPWDGNPVHIFSKICAFHMKYDEIRLDGNVARWAVHVIELSRTKRHLDRAALKVFWEKLDKHMIKFKPHLRF